MVRAEITISSSINCQREYWKIIYIDIGHRSLHYLHHKITSASQTLPSLPLPLPLLYRQNTISYFTFTPSTFWRVKCINLALISLTMLVVQKSPLILFNKNFHIHSEVTLDCDIFVLYCVNQMDKHIFVIVCPRHTHYRHAQQPSSL